MTALGVVAGRMGEFSHRRNTSAKSQTHIKMYALVMFKFRRPAKVISACEVRVCDRSGLGNFPGRRAQPPTLLSVSLTVLM